jgi:ABC-type glycerol-3-phosphate transport system permease component
MAMNALQIGLLSLLGMCVVLLLAKPAWGLRFGRYVLLTLVAAVVLMPFGWLICAAFKDPAILNEYTFLPPIDKWSRATLNLSNYATLFEPKKTLEGEITFWRHIVNSLFLASTATTVSLVLSSMGGFALAKYRFRGRSAMVTFMLASMTIPGVSLLAPTYELIYHLGWMDTYYALLVPGAVSVFGMFLFRQAIVGVPDELIEAGRMDGCSEFGIYLRLVMPLVRPMSGAFCLVTFLGAWNSFMGPSIFLSSQSKMPLPVVLNQYVGEYQQQYGVFLAGTLLSILPPAALFLALQKEFISGLTSGAVKQ